ncbi:hypothetical protein LTR97_003936 [Elasticomyces elasticus]|uniref:Uncharacterized protein n=1 Tax=Elasticomyces elasticus TaxID=574655 RepID=A0AAN7WF14_9PEZI|nr:hypothetical protein LTR97_003936 [Elasticomyces elasticus]
MADLDQECHASPTALTEDALANRTNPTTRQDEEARAKSLASKNNMAAFSSKHAAAPSGYGAGESTTSKKRKAASPADVRLPSKSASRLVTALAQLLLDDLALAKDDITS